MVAAITPATEQTIEPPPKRKVGRPTLFTAEIGQTVVKAIRNGLSPSMAAQKIGVAHTTVAGWREQFPEFDSALATAEAEFVEERLADLKACENNNGTKDVKAQELMLRRFKDFQQSQQIESTNLNLNLTAQLSPERMAEMQARHRASLERLK